MEGRTLLSADGPLPQGDYDAAAALVSPLLDEQAALADVRSEAPTIVIHNLAEFREAVSFPSEPLLPGTTILIAPGTYTDRVWEVVRLAGSAAAPITIQAQDPDDPPVFSGMYEAFHVYGSSHLRISDLVIEGATTNGINIDDGGETVSLCDLSPSHHISVENVAITQTGDGGNDDGLKITRTDYFTVRNCYFEGWDGEAIDMVGSQHGVVEDSQFIGHDQFAEVSGVQAKGGSRDILIQRNFFQNAGQQRAISIGGGTGYRYFRDPPGSTLPDGTVMDYEAKDVEVAGNRIVGGPANRNAIGWVRCNGGAVHHNTIVLPRTFVLEIAGTDLPEFAPTHDGTFYNNLIVFESSIWEMVLIYRPSNTAAETFTFANNAWFQLDAENPLVEIDLPAEEQGGVYQVDPELDSLSSPTMRIQSRDPRLHGIGADAWLWEARTLDDGDEGFGAIGPWSLREGQGFEGDVHRSVAGGDGALANWSFSVVPGQYRLAATWPQDVQGAASNAPLTILNGSTALDTVRVDQGSPPDDFTAGGAGWKNLGSFNITGDTLVVQLSDDADGFVTADAVRCERVDVVARHVFYNNSGFDGNNSAADSHDAGAIAPDKTALLPGQTATFQNYTSYSRGINGIMVDIANLLPAQRPLDPDDYCDFKVGNNQDPAGWSDAPDPVELSVRPGEGVGGSDRMTIVWADNAIQKQWLRVTVLANAKTGLAAPDVFYFGNAIAESGNSTTDAKVNAYDMLAGRDNQHTFVDPAPVDCNHDYDRDARVNAYDMLIARDNQTHFLNALKLITVPARIVAHHVFYNGSAFDGSDTSYGRGIDGVLADVTNLLPAGAEVDSFEELGGRDRRPHWAAIDALFAVP